ncbi:MAG: HIT family protein [Rhizobiaceae bacterium]
METYDPENVFAKILRGELPCHKIYEDDTNFGIMDIMPRGEGHCLVIPKAPARNILDASDEVLSSLYPAISRVARAAKAAFDADGLTIQQFNESAGGQIVFHMHVHVIPRFDGIKLRPHTGEMEDDAKLAAGAEKIRQALAASS